MTLNGLDRTPSPLAAKGRYKTLYVFARSLISFIIPEMIHPTYHLIYLSSANVVAELTNKAKMIPFIHNDDKGSSYPKHKFRSAHPPVGPYYWPSSPFPAKGQFNA